MKIIKCHVEGFGALVDTDFSFDGGISSFIFGNGHGKTTLASFIKAMFFGLESVKSNTKGFEDRIHFLPFSGARFGGNLTFSKSGSEYRIERFFDKKSQVKDTLRVFKDGKETDELGDDIGRSVFGLDRESFERTLFIDNKDAFFGSTDGINAKLNRFATGDGDFASAAQILERAERTLKAARGSNDMITSVQNQIITLKDELKNLEIIEGELGVRYAERERLDAKTREFEAEVARQGRAREREQIQRGYEMITASESEKLCEAEALKKRYPNGMPTAEELSEIREALSLTDRSKGALGATEQSQEAERRLSEYEVYFGKGVPDEAELSSIEDTVRRYEALGECLKADGDGESEPLFKYGAPDEDELALNREKVEKFKRLNVEIGHIVSESASVSSVRRVPFFLGVLIAFAAIPLVFVHTAACIAAGVVGTLVIAFSFMKPQRLGGVANLAGLRTDAQMTEESLKLFLAKYGYFTESGVVFGFAKLEGDLDRYKNELAERERRRIERENSAVERAVLEKRLSSLLSGYGISDFSDPARAVSVLRTKISEYKMLLSERERINTRRGTLLGEVDAAGARIRAILSRYSLNVGADIAELLKAIEADRRAAALLSAELDRIRSRKADYLAESSLSEGDFAEYRSRVSDLSERKTDTDAELSEYRQRLAAIDREIADAEAKLEFLPEKQSSLERAEARLADLKKKHELLSAAHGMLKIAESNLLERYVAPVKSRFEYYASSAGKLLGESFSMDRDFNLRFDSHGESRDERHLSSGQHAIAALCLRFALVDALFEKDAPFMVMDDPFVNLDEDAMQKVGALLKKLSENIQIIYLSCHNSRKI